MASIWALSPGLSPVTSQTGAGASGCTAQDGAERFAMAVPAKPQRFDSPIHQLTSLSNSVSDRAMRDELKGVLGELRTDIGSLNQERVRSARFLIESAVMNAGKVEELNFTMELIRARLEKTAQILAELEDSYERAAPAIKAQLKPKLERARRDHRDGHRKLTGRVENQLALRDFHLDRYVQAIHLLESDYPEVVFTQAAATVEELFRHQEAADTAWRARNLELVLRHHAAYRSRRAGDAETWLEDILALQR